MVQEIISPTVPPVTVSLPKGKTKVFYGVVRLATCRDPDLNVHHLSAPMYVAKALAALGCKVSDHVPSRKSTAELLAGAEGWQACWVMHAHGARIGVNPYAPDVPYDRHAHALALITALGEPAVRLE